LNNQTSSLLLPSSWDAKTSGQNWTYENEDQDPKHQEEALYGSHSREVLGWIGRSGNLFRVLQTKTIPIIDIDIDGQGSERLGPALRRIVAYAKSHLGFSARLYMTAGGLRLIVTTVSIGPREEAVAIMGEELGADPRYMRMCGRRGMYAARLEPKRERCHGSAGGYAVTRFMGTIGHGTASHEAWDIIDRHDLETMAFSGRPLA